MSFPAIATLDPRFMIHRNCKKSRTLLLASVVIVLSGFVSDAGAHDRVRDKQLSRDISELRQAVQLSPTSRENVDQRLETFWRWTNDYSLRGLPIDPDVPATVARIRDPGPRSRIALQDLQDIDRWVREFSYREANPRAIGTLSSPQLEGFEVDAFHALTVNYTVGARALEVGDGFVLGELTYGKGPLLQARDPQADNFVSIRTSEAQVEFEIEGYPIRGMFSGTMARSVIMTGPAQKVFFRIKRGRIPPDSTVSITLGDQSFGSRGVGLIAPSVDALRFRVWLHLENENLLMAMPELGFQSVGGAAAGVRGFGPSIVGAGEPFELTVRFEDKFRNLARGDMPSIVVTHEGVVVGRASAGVAGILKLPDIVFDRPGVHRLFVTAEGFDRAGEVNPILVKHTPSQRLFWGETHGHSGFSEGMGSIDGVYKFARDEARLDFMALTEHDYWMDDAEWEQLRDAARRYNEPGKFLAFLAYEWTVHAGNGGHHNIIFRTPDGRRRVPRQEVQTLDALYKTLLRQSNAEDLLLIPHAHNPGDWELNQSDTEKFVEIVSLHGTFEWFGRRYLDAGFMIGFLGGSDDHMGHPGLRPLRRNPTSDNFGGLLGLYANAKTNDAIFNAMRDIQGYATNGVRSILELELNGERMGSRIPGAASVRLSGMVHGTAPVEEVVLWKNGKPVYVRDYAIVPNAEESKSRKSYVEVRFWSDSYPRKKGGLARQWRRWRGTIQTTGAGIHAASSPQNDNPYTEFVRKRDDEGRFADFFLKTRGSYKSILLELGAEQLEASLRITGIKESPLPQESMQSFSFDVDLAQIRAKPLRLEVPAEGYDDHMIVRRVRRPTIRDMRIDIHHPEPARPGDYYYLRVRQSDGGLVWSSPFRVN